MYESLTQIKIAMKLKPGDIVWLDNGKKLEIICNIKPYLFPTFIYCAAILADNTPKVKK